MRTLFYSVDSEKNNIEVADASSLPDGMVSLEVPPGT